MSHEWCGRGCEERAERGYQTRSDVEGIMGCVGAVAKAIMAVDGKADTTTSKLYSVESELDTLTTNNDKRHDTLEKMVVMISSPITETKAGVDEVRYVFTHQIQENNQLVSSFSGKDKTVTESGVHSLKLWTGKASAKIIYDSIVDEFTDQGLFDKVRGKPNIANIGFTNDGDVFGGFFGVAVMEQKKHFYDPNTCVFSFESHGRYAAPKRFNVKADRRGN